MFGKGIYFADMVSKSANYCHTSKTSPVGLLLLCEVALGNMSVTFFTFACLFKVFCCLEYLVVAFTSEVVFLVSLFKRLVTDMHEIFAWLMMKNVLDFGGNLGFFVDSG